jgi:phosphohistidine swiveling domain-containing protein
VFISKPKYKLDEEFYRNELTNIKKRKLVRFGLRRRIVFFMDGYRLASKIVKKRWGIDVYVFEAGDGLIKSVYFDTKMNEEAAELWWKKMNEEKNFMKDLTEEIHGIVKIQKKIAQSIPQREITPKQAEKYILVFLDYWLKYWEAAFLWFCIEIIKEKIDKEIRANFKGSKKEAENFIEQVYRPEKWPLSSQEQRGLLNVGKLKGKSRETALKRHWKKYKHLAMHDSIGDSPFGIKDFEDRLKIMGQKEEYEKIKNMLDSADIEIKHSDKLLKEVELTQELKEKINFIRSFMFIRTETIDYLTMVNYAYKNVFNSLSKFFALPADAVLNMTFEEILSSLKKKKLVVPRSLVLERTKKGYAFLITPENSYLVTGEEINKLFNIVDSKRNKKKPNSLKGQVAYPGRAKGVARVIIDSQRANEIKEGEILVTTMTNPSYVPAMKKSLGIITNEGGILCHAAIMSRELGKPCIIGTKFATDIFKTGDLIELDAKKGIAKKVKQ